jgi:thiol-disulfide isomerase/thioredoxin
VKYKVILIVLLGVVVVLLGASLVLARPELIGNTHDTPGGIVDRGSVTVNSPAPGFTLSGVNGEEVRLDDYLGRIVIINFWATWCAPCKEEMPILSEYAAQHPDSIVVLGVAVNASIESVVAYLLETPVLYPVVIDDRTIVAAAYHVAGYPTSYFIDAEGIIRGKYIGFLTPRVLQQNLEPLGIIE